MSAHPIPTPTLPDEIVIHAPANGEEVGRVRVDGAEEVRAAVARARAAQIEWAKVPVAERVRKLRRFRDHLLSAQDAIIDLLVRENGKTPEEALFMEIVPVATISSWYCAKAPKILKGKKIRAWGPSIGRKSRMHLAPRGVVAIISPWNFPFSIPLGSVFPAMLAGNGVVVKPSEWTPLIMKLAKELYDTSGMPADLLQVVYGFGPTGQSLMESGVDKVEFTGSVNVGKKIGGYCGERLIPCTLELGGKAPAIVLDDADIERAAHSITWGSFANSGQVCISVERVLVDKKIASKLTDRIVELTSKLRQGDPTKGEVDVGAMTFPKQIDNVERLVEDARAKGAKILTGGRRLPGKGRFYAPTVIGGVTNDMLIARQEIFGPAVPIIEVDGEEEAIRIANDSHLGLNAYVFSRDRKRAGRVAERVRAGTIAINDVLGNFAMGELPFGGVKESGMGRVHGEAGLLAMCEARGINVDRVKAPARDFWMYPYSPKLAAKMRKHVVPRLGRLLDFISWLA